MCAVKKAIDNSGQGVRYQISQARIRRDILEMEDLDHDMESISDLFPHDDVNDDLTKLIIELWVFCHRFPSLASTLTGKRRQSIQQRVQGALLLTKGSEYGA